uniref:FBA_2 domain-containing protein n=2 Tax=Caenorhabditis tropicalis TaxID=1561998 RepID=A0A1I7U1C0_9PELO
MFELFMNKFRKNVDQLYLHNIKLESNGFILKLLNFKIKQKFVSIYSEWIHLDFLLSLDCEYITAFKNNLSAEDMNMFLRSWQEGKTNRNLKYGKLRMCSDLDVKEVLKDCGGELMDPRTSRIKFSDLCYPDKWIHGGIHIRRNDGRLAVIELTGDYLIKEDSNVTEKNIEKYLKTVELWNSRDSTWEEDWFHIYIF